MRTIRRSRWRQIGNAVPPAIGELLGREIRRQLLGERAHRITHFVPVVRPGCPKPEKTGPVAEKYLPLRGSHKEHPGTGLGPGARTRS